jgi:peptidoglycan/LPS O-acetylase OafA/YrhL
MAEPQKMVRRRRSAYLRLAIWLAGSAIGAVIVGLPDSDDRVFSFTDTHGPALVDLLGVVIVVLAWLPVAALLWSHRGRLRGGAARLVALLVLVGAVLLVAAIGSDMGSVWLVPAALLVVAQVLAVAIIARRA